MISAPRKALATVYRLPAMVSVMLVRAYQHTLSPDHGPLRHLYPYGFCRHEPTCSEFAIRELRTTSYPTAMLRIIRRLLSCHPWRKVTDEKLKVVIAKSLQ